MRAKLSALAAGLIFGLGLTVSGMINPSKVLGFLDIAGNWDPSLLFVLGGALVTTAIGFRLVQRRQAPLFAGRFHLPEASGIDTRFVSGAALFGIGWGLVGFCPGPAIAALLADGWQAALFVASAFLGMAGHRLLRRPQAPHEGPALTRH